MQIVVVSNEALKEELTKRKPLQDIIWVHEVQDVKQHPQADAYVDLLFDNHPDRMNILKSCRPKTVIINSVLYTLAETDTSFIRINAWPTFLGASIIEGSYANEQAKNMAVAVLQLFDKVPQWLPDEAGFVTPKVISMIISEAYFALAEGVSTKEEIDIAMKLGTNYPYGPFEWGQKIGLKNIVALLHKLGLQQKRYAPCPLLVQEAAAPAPP